MLFVVHDLYIVKPCVHIRKQRLVIAVRRLAACIYGDIDPLSVKRLHKSEYVINIHCHDLAARQSDSAMRLLIKHLVLHADLYKLSDRIIPAHESSDVAETYICASAAYDAFVPVYNGFVIFVIGYGISRTCVLAAPASRALCRVDLKFRFKALCLRIVAPPASEVAAFEEHRRPYSVSVMY